MHRLIQVGNLSDAVGDSALEELFAFFGSVRRAAVHRHQDTGRSTGVGSVEMESADGGSAAIAALNHKEHWGRILSVCWSKSSQANATDQQHLFGPMNM